MPVDRSIPILVVEDHSATSLILRAMLEHLGFRDIDEAADGEAALARLREKPYALVISDWNMEPMTGHRLLKEVRADPDLAAVRFIIATSDLKAVNVVAAKRAGVDSYLVKPFTAEALRAKIIEVFAA